MNRLLRFFLILSFLFFGGNIFAYIPKEGNVTASFGPYLYRTNYRGSSSGALSPFKTGEALIVNGEFNDHESLEIAFYHLNKIFFREEGPLVISESTELLHIGMGYRRWINPYISASMLFYSSYSMGEPQIVHNDFAPGQEVDTSARDITDYGLDFSLQSQIWEKKNQSLNFAIQYSYSLTNKPNEYSDQYGFLIVFKQLIQGKDFPE